MITRACVWLLISAWSLTGMHLTLVAHGLNQNGALIEADAAVSVQLQHDNESGVHNGSAVVESQVDHTCSLAELLKTPLLVTAAVEVEPPVMIDQPVDQLLSAAGVTPQALERAPKGSPPRV